MKKLKQTQNGDAQKKRSGREVRGVSPEAGRESMVGKICDLKLAQSISQSMNQSINQSIKQCLRHV